jgi:hypothetical protein
MDSTSWSRDSNIMEKLVEKMIVTAVEKDSPPFFLEMVAFFLCSQVYSVEHTVTVMGHHGTPVEKSFATVFK